MKRYSTEFERVEEVAKGRVWTGRDARERGLVDAIGGFPEALDLGALGPERKLYFREIIARFGYELALNWNVGEENSQTPEEQLEQAQQLAYSDLAGMVSEASKQQTFNRELLQTTVESLLQGVSVVDRELRLVAWNSRYEEMFH